MMDKIKIVFIFFVFLSLTSLISGILSGVNLADIEKSRTLLIEQNPENVEFRVSYNSSCYVPELKFEIVNNGRFSFKITKIVWTVYLINNSKRYQANEYSDYSMDYIVLVNPMSSGIIDLIDRNTTKLWCSYVLHNLLWITSHERSNKALWSYTLTIIGQIGNFNGDMYKYSYRTWYLWKIAEVNIYHEGTDVAP